MESVTLHFKVHSDLVARVHSVSNGSVWNLSVFDRNTILRIEMLIVYKWFFIITWNSIGGVLSVMVIIAGNRIGNQSSNSAVFWGYRIHWLHLFRRVRPLPNECPGYDIKQSDSETPVMLEFWGMGSTTSLSSLPGALRVVAPDRVLSMGLLWR